MGYPDTANIDYRWKFENNGNDSVGGNNLTMTDPSYAADDKREGLYSCGFNGTTTKGVPGSSFYLVDNYSQWSFTCMLKAPTAGSTRAIYAEGNSSNSNPYFRMAIGGDNKVIAAFRRDSGGTVFSITGTTALTAGKWYFFTAIETTGNYLILFINGQEECRVSGYTVGTYSPNRVRIGCLARAAESTFFSDSMDDVIIWDTALSTAAGEIDALYRQYLPTDAVSVGTNV